MFDASAFACFPFFTISYPDRLHRIASVIARCAHQSSLVAMRDIATCRGRISAFTGPDRFADIRRRPAALRTAIITKLKSIRLNH
ncbi:hypothetical protein [Burkholderia sp. JP2-270]|uniref:hypothetical protein n=1 Tax=Burkholderia sp. JP2-270 TaxID=2217913 RepID=UPI0013A6E39A|nr:hypothetical protein [Burkholderia sp. JP2-270]